MVTILKNNETPSFSSQLIKGLTNVGAEGLPNAISNLVEQKKRQDLLKTIYSDTSQVQRTNDLASHEPRQIQKNAQPQEISDRFIAELASNPKKEDQMLADFLQKSKTASQKKFQEERKFQSSLPGSKVPQERAEVLRESLPAKEAALSQIIAGIAERGGIEKAGDLLYQATGFEPFLSKSGAQIQSALKEYLIGSLSRIPGGRLNKWLDQQVGSMLQSLGKNDLANESISVAFKAAQDIDKNWLKNYDRLFQENMDQFGYIPATFSKQVDNANEQFAQEKQNESAYELRSLYEQSQNPRELTNLKKVIDGTPLTIERAKAMRDKYGAKRAEEIINQLGYDFSMLERLLNK